MTNIKGVCPICDAAVSLPADTEESEIVTCGDCSNRLVVKKLGNKGVTLEKAPEVEEDWGE